MAATGRAPEEITGLTEDDLEFGPHGVTITFTKGRAQARRRQTFTAEPDEAGTLHPPGSRLDAAEIVADVLELNRPRRHPRRTRPAAPHPDQHPIRQAQPLHHERRRSRRREMPRRRDRAARAPGPPLDRCQPGRCTNSIIAGEHLPIWTAERSSLNRLLDTGTLAPNHRRRIEAELSEVEHVLNRATP